MKTDNAMKLFCQQCGKAFPVKKDDPSDVRCPDCGTAAQRPEQYPGPGVVIGDFLIEKLLSSGGMGLVFEAKQLSLDRPVALKVLLGEYTQDREYVAGLFREARAAAKINHPNIVQAYAVGDDNGVFYFAMELVRGDTMKSIIAKEGILPFDRSARVICDIAKALDVAWREQKLVHQDIKPDNIMMDESRGLAKLADLGLAKTGSTESIDAGEDEVFGTPQYISPEQLTGVPTDVRSDIYSLGATFFQFVTGRFPYIAPSVEELAKMHDAGNLEPPQSVNPEVPDELNRIIMKMMARNLEDRYQTPEPLIRDLEIFLQTWHPDVAGKVKKACVPRKPFPVKKALKISSFAIGGVAALAVVAAVVLLLWGRYGNLPSALKPAAESVFGELLVRTPDPVAEQTTVEKKTVSRYQQIVADVLEKFSGVEAVDRQWIFLSKPENADDAALLSRTIGAFAAADEARCAVARGKLKNDFIRQREQLRAEDAERKRIAREQELARKRNLELERRAEAARKSSHLAENRRLAAKSVRDCVTAAISAAHGGDGKSLSESLKQLEICGDTLAVAYDEDQVLKDAISFLVRGFPGAVSELRKKMVQIGNINADSNIYFRKGGRRYIISNISPQGKLICINDNNEKVTFDFAALNSAQQKSVLKGIGSNGRFYFDIYRRRIPDRSSVPDGFWQKCLELLK